jgi:hypothetical protein
MACGVERGGAGDEGQERLWVGLQPALEGKALAIVQEYRDRADPYKEAMAHLAKDYGDDIQLATEYLKPVRDTRRALGAAEHAWERFSGMAKPLKKLGLSLQDILWHQVAMRIPPAEFGAPRKWEEWVKDQRRSYNTVKATVADKGKKGKEKDTVTYLTNHLANLKEKDTVTYLPNRLERRSLASSRKWTRTGGREAPPTTPNPQPQPSTPVKKGAMVPPPRESQGGRPTMGASAAAEMRATPRTNATGSGT